MHAMQQQAITKRLEREQQIVTRAVEDSTFRKSLVSDPKATLAKEYGVTIPANADVRVFEESANSFYVVLPAPVAESGSELTEDQLEAVAGGWFVQLAWTLVCFGNGNPGGTHP